MTTDGARFFAENVKLYIPESNKRQVWSTRPGTALRPHEEVELTAHLFYVRLIGLGCVHAFQGFDLLRQLPNLHRVTLRLLWRLHLRPCACQKDPLERHKAVHADAPMLLYVQQHMMISDLGQLTLLSCFGTSVANASRISFSTWTSETMRRISFYNEEQVLDARAWLPFGVGDL
jgi:hypothetical protein